MMATTAKPETMADLIAEYVSQTSTYAPDRVEIANRLLFALKETGPVRMTCADPSPFRAGEPLRERTFRYMATKFVYDIDTPGITWTPVADVGRFPLAADVPVPRHASGT